MCSNVITIIFSCTDLKGFFSLHFFVLKTNSVLLCRHSLIFFVDHLCVELNGNVYVTCSNRAYNFPTSLICLVLVFNSHFLRCRGQTSVLKKCTGAVGGLSEASWGVYKDVLEALETPFVAPLQL